ATARLRFRRRAGESGKNRNTQPTSPESCAVGPQPHHWFPVRGSTVIRIGAIGVTPSLFKDSLRRSTEPKDIPFTDSVTMPLNGVTVLMTEYSPRGSQSLNEPSSAGGIRTIGIPAVPPTGKNVRFGPEKGPDRLPDRLLPFLSTTCAVTSAPANRGISTGTSRLETTTDVVDGTPHTVPVGAGPLWKAFNV